MRQPADGTPLVNDDLAQVAPVAAAAGGHTMIITGSLITFEDGLQQTAAVWTWPRRMGEWSVTRLPEAGKRSEALSARCADACWASGYVDGQVALWQVGPGEPVGMSLPDGLAVDGGTRTILTADGRPGVVFSLAGRSTLVVENQAGWSTFAAPDGTVVDAIAIGDRVYAILGTDQSSTRLWTASLE